MCLNLEELMQELNQHDAVISKLLSRWALNPEWELEPCNDNYVLLFETTILELGKHLLLQMEIWGLISETSVRKYSLTPRGKEVAVACCVLAELERKEGPEFL